MHRSARQPEKYADLGNEAQKESNAKKKLWGSKQSNIATLDNGTMVEAYQFLNYCQLAKSSLVSKRFRNVIQTHRHKLAFLYVEYIRMYSLYNASATINVFNNELCPEAYNEWVICNSYSKQTPLKSQVANEESTQSITNRYQLIAYANYKDSSRGWSKITSVFSAGVELNHENWPLFQHFIRLVTDPFIYIDYVQLTYQNDVLNLLAVAINSDQGRLQCEQLNFDLERNSQKFLTWTKNYMSCSKLYIYGKGELNHDKALLDFFVTGANCTPSIDISYCDLSKVVSDFVQKFLDLKNSGESQLVEAIEGKIRVSTIESFNRDYAEFIVKDERSEDDCSTAQVFELVNIDIGKKMQLTAETYQSFMSHFWIKIISL